MSDQHRMTDEEFKAFNIVLVKLWPAMVDDMNDEQVKGWRYIVGGSTEDDAINALRVYFRNSKQGFKPTPGRIRDLINLHSDKPKVVSNHEEISDEDVTRHRQHWIKIDLTMDDVGGDMEIHKASALAGDWRLEWAKNMPVTSKLWMGIINNRVNRFLNPHDSDPDPWRSPQDKLMGILGVPVKTNTPGNIDPELVEELI